MKASPLKQFDKLSLREARTFLDEWVATRDERLGWLSDQVGLRLQAAEAELPTVAIWALELTERRGSPGAEPGGVPAWCSGLEQAHPDCVPWLQDALALWFGTALCSTVEDAAWQVLRDRSKLWVNYNEPGVARERGRISPVPLMGAMLERWEVFLERPDRPEPLKATFEACVERLQRGRY